MWLLPRLAHIAQTSVRDKDLELLQSLFRPQVEIAYKHNGGREKTSQNRPCRLPLVTLLLGLGQLPGPQFRKALLIL